MALGDRLGVAGLILSFIGLGITILWPTKRWIGWTCVAVAAVLCLAWGGIEWRQRNAQKTVVDDAKRLEFLSRRGDRLKAGVYFTVKLDHAYSPQELDPYRIALQITSVSEGVLWVAGYGPVGGLEVGGLGEIPMTQNVVWSAQGDLSKTLQRPKIGWKYLKDARELEVHFGPQGDAPYQSLAEFDQTGLSIFVSETVLSRLNNIEIRADDYVLLSLPKRCIDRDYVYPPAWPRVLPEELPERWATEKWIRLVPKGFKANGPQPEFPVFPLSFNDYTPILVRDFSQMDESSTAIPSCGGT